MTGALTGGQMGPGEMLQQRLRCDQVKEALGILEAMDWSTMGDECFRGLSAVTNHLLRLELNAEREGGSLSHSDHSDLSHSESVQWPSEPNLRKCFNVQNMSKLRKHLNKIFISDTL